MPTSPSNPSSWPSATPSSPPIAPTSRSTKLQPVLSTVAVTSFGYLFWDGTSFASPLIAGAVAVIKSARPNLMSDDYRSLVVNTASPMVDPGGNTWPVQTAGAGSLNVLRGLQSSVTANPSRSASAPPARASRPSQQIMLKKSTARPSTYNLTFEGMSVTAPATDRYQLHGQLGRGLLHGVIPQLQRLALVLHQPAHGHAGPFGRLRDSGAPGDRQRHRHDARAGLAAGLYQGFIDVTPVGSSTPQARVPYWYAVPAARADARRFRCFAAGYQRRFHGDDGLPFRRQLRRRLPRAYYAGCHSQTSGAASSTRLTRRRPAPSPSPTSGWSTSPFRPAPFPEQLHLQGAAGSVTATFTVTTQ